MRKFLLLIFCLVVFACDSGSGGAPKSTGTPTEPSFDNPFQTIMAECRHKALIAAAIYEEAGYQTRLLYGPSDGENG